MPVQFGSLNFPFEAAMQAQQMKNQNIQNLWQSYRDIGAGAGNVAGAYGKYKALGMLQQALAAQRNGGAPVDTASMLPSLMALNPESGGKAIADYFNPSTQADIGYKKAETAKTQAELSGLLPSQQATLSEQERSHRDAEEFRRLMLQQQAMVAENQRQEHARSSMQDEQLRAEKLKEDIRSHNWLSTHLAPWQTTADKSIAAIKGPMDYGYTGQQPQIQRKILKGRLYINTGSGWVQQ